MQDTFYSTETKLRAIIICDPADPLSGNTALKYDYVYKSYWGGVNKFIEFAKKFPTAVYVNFYSRKSGNYLGRIYLTENLQIMENTKTCPECRAVIVHNQPRQRVCSGSGNCPYPTSQQGPVKLQQPPDDFIHCQYCGQQPDECKCKFDPSLQLQEKGII